MVLIPFKVKDPTKDKPFVIYISAEHIERVAAKNDKESVIYLSGNKFSIVLGTVKEISESINHFLLRNK